MFQKGVEMHLFCPNKMLVTDTIRGNEVLCISQFAKEMLQAKKKMIENNCLGGIYQKKTEVGKNVIFIDERSTYQNENGLILLDENHANEIVIKNKNNDVKHSSLIYAVFFHLLTEECFVMIRKNYHISYYYFSPLKGFSLVEDVKTKIEIIEGSLK